MSMEPDPTTRPQEIVVESQDQAKQEVHRDAEEIENQSGSSNDAPSNYPNPLSLALILFALSLSLFLTGLDENIISTAIPVITDHFHSLGDVGWYASAYLLALASTQLAWGKIYSLSYVKWSYCVAVAIFEAGSLLAGLAPTSSALIIGRAISGLGAAGIVAGAFIILAHSLPLRRRPMFTSLLSLMYGAAATSGPVLGGVFTSRLSWRWCFLINIPFGVVTALLIALTCKINRAEDTTGPTLWQRIGSFDWIGTVLFVPCIVCLLLALQMGGVTVPWRDGRVIALFVVAGVLFLAFVTSQAFLREKASVPGRFIKQRSMAFGAAYSFCMSAGMEQFQYFLPIWFQAVEGVSPIESGLRSLSLVISFVVFSIIAGTLITTIGPYKPFMLAGSMIQTIGAGFLTTLTPSSRTGRWIGFQILAGAGVGFGLDQPQIAAQTVFGIEDVPIATAVMMSAQTLGSAVFVSVGNSMFDTRLKTLLRRFLPEQTIFALINDGATTYLQSRLGSVNKERVFAAYSEALATTWYLAAALAAVSFVMAIGMEPLSVKEEDSKDAAGVAQNSEKA